MTQLEKDIKLRKMFEKQHKNCGVQEVSDEISTEAKEIFLKTDYKTRLAITLFVMEKIWEHAVEGGSYRVLIYSRLGFNTDAYSYLYPVGMNISNEFDVKE